MARALRKMALLRTIPRRRRRELKMAKPVQQVLPGLRLLTQKQCQKMEVKMKIKMKMEVRTQL